MDIKSIVEKHREKKDPNLALFKAVSELQKKIDEEIKKAIEILEEKLQSEVREMVEECRDNLKASYKEVDFNEVLKSVKGQQGDRGEKGEKGDKGPQGNQGIKGVDGKDGMSGKDGKNGVNGRNAVDGKNGIDGKDGRDGKDGSPDTPEQIADKLNVLEERVDIKVIKGLTNWLNNLRKSIREKSIVSGGGMGNWVTEAPSGSINGVNVTFTLTSNVASGGKALILLYQGQVLEQGNQFTISGKTITTLFTPTTGTVLFAMYVRT